MVLMLSCAIVSSLWKRFGVTSAEQLAMCVSREPVMGCHSNEIHKPVQERDSRNVTSQLLHVVSGSDESLLVGWGRRRALTGTSSPLVFLRTTTTCRIAPI